MKHRTLRLLLAAAAAVLAATAAEMPSGKRYRNSLGMEFIRIEPGSFVMGHDEMFTLSRSSAEPKGDLATVQSRDGMIHLISGINDYRFNLKWLETAPPALPAQ